MPRPARRTVEARHIKLQLDQAARAGDRADPRREHPDTAAQKKIAARKSGRRSN
jgi:hypothetical protein